MPFTAAVLCDGHPVPLPPGFTPARSRSRSRAVAKTQALNRFRNATGLSDGDCRRLGFVVRIAHAEPSPPRPPYDPVAVRRERRIERVAARRVRATDANKLVGAIASCGRRFFDHTVTWGGRPREGGAVSHFAVDASGRVWFVDGYRGDRIATLHPNCRWRGFSEGGTLRQLVEQLSRYVMWGAGPDLILAWPKWACGGDPWGYGDDMEAVREAARCLGLYHSAPSDHA